MSKSAKVYFKNLDGFRFLAFFLVFIQHSFPLPITIANDYFYKIKIAITGAGDVGVSFFFVLSGFLINYLILKEIHLKGKLDVLKFYIRRSLRIWPLYFLNITAAFFIYPFLKSLLRITAVDYANQPLWYYTFASNFDFINVMKFFPGKDFIVLDVTWSIAVEEQFYLVIPILYLLFVGNRSYWLNILVIASSLLFRAFNSQDLLLLNFHTFGVMSDLAMGGIGAYLAFAQPNWFRSFIGCSRIWIRMLYIFGTLLLLHRIYLDELLPVFNRLIYSCFFLFIILEQTYLKNRLYNMKEKKWISSLGKYTYALYLLHPWSLQIVIVIQKATGFAIMDNWMMIILANLFAFFISLLLSVLSYHFIERYFINLKERFAYIHKS